MWFVWIINAIFAAGLFANSILFVPQIIKLLQNKHSDDISLTTFIGFCVIQLAIVFYGLIHKDWILFSGYVLSLSACGTVTSLSIYYRFCSRFKKGRALSDAEKLAVYRNIFRSLPEHVYAKDLQGRVIASNLNNAKGLGFDVVEELLGKTDLDLQDAETGKLIYNIDQEVMKKGETITVEEPGMISDPVGTVYLSKKTPLRDEKGKVIGLVGASFNITQRRNREVQKDKLFEEIIAIMPGHVYWTDREGVMLGCNDEQAQSAGCRTRQDFIGKKLHHFPWRNEAGAIYENNEKVMQTGVLHVLEEVSTMLDGTERVFLSHKVPLKDASNQVVGLLGVSFDITQRKETEALELQASAAEEKSKGMAMIAGSVAHELRTPLRTIESNLEGIQRFFPALLDGYQAAKQADLIADKLYPREVEALLTAVDDSLLETKSAKLVIDSLLKTINYGKVKQGELSVCKVSACIKEALKRYPFKDSQDALVECDVSDDFAFMGNRLMLIHVLFNLIKNALYYIKAAGKGRIYIWLESSEQQNCLCFKDTAMGIGEKILPNIFDRFFSKTENGSGVGLAFCREVLNGFGGEIACESVESQFAKFTLTFPVTEAVAYEK